MLSNLRLLGDNKDNAILFSYVDQRVILIIS